MCIFGEKRNPQFRDFFWVILQICSKFMTLWERVITWSRLLSPWRLVVLAILGFHTVLRDTKDNRHSGHVGAPKKRNHKKSFVKSTPTWTPRCQVKTGNNKGKHVLVICIVLVKNSNINTRTNKMAVESQVYISRKTAYLMQAGIPTQAKQ